MVRIRSDDIGLLDSSQFSEERAIGRVKAHINWAKESTNKIHWTFTVLTKDLQQFPLLIEILRTSGLDLQLHGHEHIDYNKLSKRKIIDQLEASFDFFIDNFGFRPDVWATPWGADGPAIREAASDLGLKVETTKGMIKPNQALKILNKDGLDSLQGTSILCHWWERGLALPKLVYEIKYGKEKNKQIHPSWY